MDGKMYDEHIKDENDLSQDREIWKDVKDWDGLYQVSSEGRVRDAEGKIIKPKIDQDGFYRVRLWKKYYPLHQIVAEAFIGDRPGRGWCAKHRNGKRNDNRAENLMWRRKSEVIPIRCVETSLTFRSIKEAAERTGGTYSEIWKAVTGKQETAYGYHWERID